MSKVGISLKIDVTKIEEGRLYQGKTAKYLDATVFVDLDNFDQYDNSGMITQDITKEERGRGVKGPILGNCKVFWKGDGKSQSKEQIKYEKDSSESGLDNSFEDDIPF